jgi:hypothetical protein
MYHGMNFNIENLVKILFDLIELFNFLVLFLTYQSNIFTDDWKILIFYGLIKQGTII